MTYSLLNSVFLGLAFWFFVATMAIIGVQMRKRAAAARSADEDVDSLVLPTVPDGERPVGGPARRTRDQRSIPSSARRPNLLMKYALTLLVLLVFTAVFDNLIIAAGIVAYDPAKISGIMIGIAPVEDFAYTVAAVLVLPTLWGLLGHFGPLKGKPQGGAK